MKRERYSAGRPAGRWLGLAQEKFGGVELRASMATLEMSPAEVAELCGVTVRAVQLWLAGERPIPVLARRVLKGAALGLVSVRTLRSL